MKKKDFYTIFIVGLLCLLSYYKGNKASVEFIEKYFLLEEEHTELVQNHELLTNSLKNTQDSLGYMQTRLWACEKEMIKHKRSASRWKTWYKNK